MKLDQLHETTFNHFMRSAMGGVSELIKLLPKKGAILTFSDDIIAANPKRAEDRFYVERVEQDHRGKWRVVGQQTTKDGHRTGVSRFHEESFFLTNFKETQELGRKLNAFEKLS